MLSLETCIKHLDVRSNGAAVIQTKSQPHTLAMLDQLVLAQASAPDKIIISNLETRLKIICSRVYALENRCLGSRP
jgi:hypothetical protein